MDAAVIGVIGTLSGTIIGGIIGYFTATRIISRQEFNRAAAKFRCVFVKEIRMLDDRFYTERVFDMAVEDVLRPKASQYEKAMIMFRFHIKKPKRIGFDKAWENLCYPEEGYKNTGGPPFIGYTRGRIPLGSSEPEERKHALQNILNLLDYAKPK